MLWIHWILVRNAMIAVKAAKKIFQHVLPLFLQKFTANFTAVLTKNYHICCPTLTHSDLISQEVSVEQRQLAQWNKQLKACRGQRFESARGRIFFVRIQKTRWKWTFHCDSPHSSQKDLKNTLWKIFFFHRISPHFLRKFTVKPWPGHRNTNSTVTLLIHTLLYPCDLSLPCKYYFLLVHLKVG